MMKVSRKKCRNSIIFLPLRFYVKSFLIDMEPIRLHIIRMTFFDLPKLISRKIRESEKLLDFHTVKIESNVCTKHTM